MAFMQCHCFSDVLGVTVSFWAIIPQAARRQIGMSAKARSKRHPTLYLLHGLSDDHTIWMRRTSIERYASEAGLAVIMPAVQRSFYTDMAHGYKYWEFISKEIPALAEQFFPLSTNRGDRFVAGLSMGGYGAFKLGLRCPDAFAAAASLSGALDMTFRRELDPKDELHQDLKLVYGGIDKIAGTENDLLHLARKAVRSKSPKAKLYQWCGREDFLYQQNVMFRDLARKLGLDLTYEEGPGTHEWRYWDTQIQRVIEWLPLAGR